MEFNNKTLLLLILVGTTLIISVHGHKNKTEIEKEILKKVAAIFPKTKVSYPFTEYQTAEKISTLSAFFDYGLSTIKNFRSSFRTFLRQKRTNPESSNQSKEILDKLDSLEKSSYYIAEITGIKTAWGIAIRGDNFSYLYSTGNIWVKKFFEDAAESTINSLVDELKNLEENVLKRILDLVSSLDENNLNIVNDVAEVRDLIEIYVKLLKSYF